MYLFSFWEGLVYELKFDGFGLVEEDDCDLVFSGVFGKELFFLIIVKLEGRVDVVFVLNCFLWWWEG